MWLQNQFMKENGDHVIRILNIVTQLNKAYQELERRITEHDNAVASGFERTDITLQVCV